MNDHRALPRFRRRQEEADSRRKIARILLETGEAAPERAAAGATAPGDVLRLRGIPAIGRGVGGAMAGTDPARVIERADRDE